MVADARKAHLPSPPVDFGVGAATCRKVDGIGERHSYAVCMLLPVTLIAASVCGMAEAVRRMAEAVAPMPQAVRRMA
jgi:hypothetical protein